MHEHESTRDRVIAGKRRSSIRHALGIGLAIAGSLAMPPASAQAPAPRAHTAGANVHVLTPPLAMPTLGRSRTLRIYLPPGYAASTKRYPVAYLFDGQNLFDDATSYAGEWGVDESMDRLAREGGIEAIVVGIDHGEELRINELIPYWNLRFIPNQGIGFLDDVVRAIKPFVDANWRTLPDRSHTVLGGSSLGGLEADYGVHRYPRVFGRALVFSPSYWVSEEAFDIARREPLPGDTRVWLYIGGREGEGAVSDTLAMARLLLTQAGMAGRVAVRIVDDAAHDEAAWRSEFPRAMRWLLEALPSPAPVDARGGMPVP